MGVFSTPAVSQSIMMSGMSYSSCFAQNALESDCSSQSKPENIRVAVANLIVDPTKNTSLTILFDFKNI